MEVLYAIPNAQYQIVRLVKLLMVQLHVQNVKKNFSFNQYTQLVFLVEVLVVSATQIQQFIKIKYIHT